MTNELLQKLYQILDQKYMNLRPENLKTGITCLGVNGEYSGDMKIYDTVEAMTNDFDNVTRDTLALVYNYEQTDFLEGSHARYVLFPGYVGNYYRVSSRWSFKYVGDTESSFTLNTQQSYAIFEGTLKDGRHLRIHWEGSNYSYTRQTIEIDNEPYIQGTIIDFGGEIEAVTYHDWLKYFLKIVNSSVDGVYKREYYGWVKIAGQNASDTDEQFYFESGDEGINVRFGYVLPPLEVNDGDYTVTAQRASYNRWTYEQDGEIVTDDSCDIQFKVLNNNVNTSIANKSDGVIKIDICDKEGNVIYTRTKTEWSVPNKGDYDWVELNDHIMQSTENMTKEQLMQAYSFNVEIVYEPAPVYRYTVDTKLGSQASNVVEIVSPGELTENADGSITLPETVYPLSANSFQIDDWNENSDKPGLTLFYIFSIPKSENNRWGRGVLEYSSNRLAFNGQDLGFAFRMDITDFSYTPSEGEIMLFNLVFDKENKKIKMYLNGELQREYEEDMLYGQIKLNKGNFKGETELGIVQNVYGLAIDMTKVFTTEEIAEYYNNLTSTLNS